MNLNAHGLSDKGVVRPHNEDAFYLDASTGVFAVADGMGGHAAGEVAAGLAIDAIRRVLAIERTQETDLPALFKRAITEANQRIAEKTRERPEYSGMGTTAVLALVDGSKLWIAHVGDSRAYRIRQGQIHQLTSDHSFVNELVRLGMLSREQAARDPRRNVVTRALGSGPSVIPDITEDAIEPKDLILLCSDGLNSMLADESILERVLAAGSEPEQVCAELVAAANAAGGEDNVTVIAFEAVGVETTTAETTLPVAPPAESSERESS